MTLGARLRQVALRGGRRQAVQGRLVRVDQPTPAPSPRLALPAPEWPLCPRCRTRHEPRPLPGRGGSQGLAAAYSQQLLPDPTRPAPLGRDPGHTLGVVHDQVNPWRHGTPDPPPPDSDLAALRAELRADPDPDPAPAPAGDVPGRPPGGRGLRLVDVIQRLGGPPPWA